MPVNWAFPAAQGEPESFLTVLGSVYCCKEFLMAGKISRWSEISFSNS